MTNSRNGGSLEKLSKRESAILVANSKAFPGKNQADSYHRGVPMVSTRPLASLLVLALAGGIAPLAARPVIEEIARDMKGVEKELRDRVHSYKRDLGRTTKKIQQRSEDTYPMVIPTKKDVHVFPFDNVHQTWKKLNVKELGDYQTQSFTIRTPRGFEFPQGVWAKRTNSQSFFDRFGLSQRVDIPVEGFAKGVVRFKAKVHQQSKTVHPEEQVAFPLLLGMVFKDKSGKLLEWTQRFYYLGESRNNWGIQVARDEWFKKTFEFRMDNLKDPAGESFTPEKLQEVRIYGQGWDFEFWSYPVVLQLK